LLLLALPEYKQGNILPISGRHSSREAREKKHILKSSGLRGKKSHMVIRKVVLSNTFGGRGTTIKSN